MSDLIPEVNKEEDFPSAEDENFFKEQDKKFEELHKKLVKLKEENRRQMDVIINNLDELIASKTFVEKTLEQSDKFDDPILDKSNMTIADLLSTVTGFIDESKDKNSADPTSSDETSKNIPSSLKDDVHTSEDEIEVETEFRNRIESKTKSHLADIRALCDSTKLLESLSIQNTDDQKDNHKNDKTNDNDKINKSVAIEK